MVPERDAIVTPPWDLCGFDPDFDPYSEPIDVSRYTYLSSRWPSHVERVVDPNARDGEWRELAFMPHPIATAARTVDGRELGEWEVPRYLTVAEALDA